MILFNHQNNSGRKIILISKEKKLRQKMSNLLNFAQMVVMGRYLTPCLTPKFMVIITVISA